MALTVCFIFFNLNGYSQKSKVEKKLSRAIESYKRNEYVVAIDKLKEILSEDNESYQPLKYIANSYRKINDYENAEFYFNLVVNSVNSEAEDHLYFGQVLKANGKLAAAKEQFVKFSEKSENSFLGNLMVQSFDQINKWENEPKNFQSIAKKGTGLNSSQSEYGLLLFQDKYYITSNREENFNSPESFSWDGTNFTSILEIDTAQINNPKGDFVAVSGKMNTDYHDGPLTINKSETSAIITRIDNQLRGRGFVNKMKLYEGSYINGKWRNFEALPFNSDDFSNGHACYGMNDSIIYFASDRPGGFGGMDIYESKKVDGSWTAPKNLGASINTSSNEVFPYYYKGKLYYSSSGFAGYGGLDILVSEYKKAWQSPTNLKSPINSSRDDFGIYFVTDSTGYYASNREGGEGEDDIYSFYKSSSITSVGIFGLFEYKGLPIEGTKIILKDHNDSTIAIEYTDKQGRFRYANLPYKEDLFLTIETEDPQIMEDGRLYLTDENGEKIKFVKRWKNGAFKFNALPVEEVKDLDLMLLADDPLLKQLKFAGSIYKKLPGDFKEEVLVYLVDEEGQIIDSVFTDKFGNFNFQKLALDKDADYFVRLKEDDPELNLALINKEERFYKTVNLKEGRYKLFTGEEMGNVNKGYTGIIARLEFEGKPLPFTKVDIYDENNKLVGTVFTNASGEFQYNKLKLDQNYFFELPATDEDTRAASKLYVVNTEGDPLYLINRLKNGLFSFKALPMDEYEEIQTLEETLVPQLIALKGQVFKKLQGDYSNKLKVYLLDEDGVVIDSVYTNDKGKFNFERLSADRNYTFKVDKEEDFNLALLDGDDRILEQAIINEKGNFTYKKLTYQVASYEPLEAIDATLIEDKLSHEVFGQVYQKLPGDFEAGMEVYIYNESGDLIGTTFTDKEGKFKFKKLRGDENYYFRIEHHEEDFQLITLDDEEKVLAKTIKNENGHFKYHRLDFDDHKILIEDAHDHHQILYYDEEKVELDEFTVYYRFDTVKLNTVSKKTLNSFIKLIKGQNFYVEVHSYTDNRGAKSYNASLSKRRTEEVIAYLTKAGINRDKIEGNYYGELRPVVDCETKKCDNDDHALNRRTVLKLRKTSIKKE